MDKDLVTLIVGIGAPAITVIGGLPLVLRSAREESRPRGRRSSRRADTGSTETSTPPAPTPPPSTGLSPDAKFDEARTWYDVIQHFVEDAVEDATKPLKEKIEQYTQRDRIVSRFVQRLYWWDESGRRGPMPRLTYEEQRALDLDLVPEDTGPHPDRRWMPPPDSTPEQYP